MSLQTVTVSVEMEAPIWRVYRNWRRLEEISKLCPERSGARWLSKDRLYWREEFAGQTVESTFHLTLHERECSVSWHSLTGPESSGSATCTARPGGSTIISLTVHFQEDETFQSMAAVESRHFDYLRAFKAFVESVHTKESSALG